jgi:hypothetical protein
MDELVNLVVKKTGLPKETAQMVVKLVPDYLKKKLPPTVRPTIDAVLNGGQAEAAMNMLGGMLNVAQKTGKKK